MTGPCRIAFLYVGGVHHVTHTLPVAAALSRKRETEVTAFCADGATEQMIMQALVDFPGARVAVRRLRRWAILDRLGKPSLAKLPMFWRNRRQFTRFDAIVTAECTSIALKRMGVSRPLFICLPHGAGDRAVSFEPRFRLFDRVLVPGPRQRDGWSIWGVPPERVRQIGYPKAEYLGARATASPGWFDNDRPIVLYNPHFRAVLSSLDQAHDIARAIIAGTDLNLVVAPHIRAFEGASDEILRRWTSMAVPGRVLVDTGSPRLIDLSYVAAADLYLGDVSSQVYEFLLLRLRPCVFVNAHQVKWRDDPDYAFWHLGEVVSPDDIVSAVERALRDPKAFEAAQQKAVAETFAPLPGSAERAAAAILACVEEAA